MNNLSRIERSASENRRRGESAREVEESARGEHLEANTLRDRVALSGQTCECTLDVFAVGGGFAAQSLHAALQSLDVGHVGALERRRGQRVVRLHGALESALELRELLEEVGSQLEQQAASAQARAEAFANGAQFANNRIELLEEPGVERTPCADSWRLLQQRNCFCLCHLSITCTSSVPAVLYY